MNNGFYNFKIVKYNILCVNLISCLLLLLCEYAWGNICEQMSSDCDRINNTRLVDLSDINSILPLDPISTKQILWRTEEWEYNAWNRGSDDTLGYPSLVKNIHGKNPDNKYYLFYAQHDSYSGIGCAVAEHIEGPYRKISEIDKSRKDSQVLQPEKKHIIFNLLVGKRIPFHYSSPCVLWDEDKQKWIMYFHYYKNEWSDGKGHQKTGVATCSDLSSYIWEIYTDANGEILPVFPVTKSRWMNSQSSYHSIQRLPDGRWLSFLRGTGGEYNEQNEWKQDTTKLGFALSFDSIDGWTYNKDNPILSQQNTGGSRTGVLRPAFVGNLGNSEFLIVWSESDFYDNKPRIIYNITKDFHVFLRDKRGYAGWIPFDGPVSPWRDGAYLYLFTGKVFYKLQLKK